jgi:hypothetical protein
MAGAAIAPPGGINSWLRAAIGRPPSARLVE